MPIILGTETLTLPDGAEVDVQIGLGLTLTGYRPAPLVPAPAADWQFQGNLNDSSGNGHNFSVVSGTAQYVSTPDGQGLGGPGAFVLAESSFAIGNPFSSPRTIVITAKPLSGLSPWGVTWQNSTPTGVLQIASNADGSPTQTVSVSSGASNLYGADTGISASDYIAVAFVMNGDDSWSLYANGALLDTGTAGLQNSDAVTCQVTVGDDGEGIVERVRIYNAALSAAQVASLTP
jgi:hypothetical protein